MLRYFIKIILGQVRNKIRKFLQIPTNYIGNNGCIRAAASFSVMNQIEGDYLEFGVWQGYSFVVAYHAIKQKRLEHYKRDYKSPEYDKWKLNEPRYFAFDSYAGLPGGGSHNRMIDYQEGAYSCSEEMFLDNIRSADVDTKDVVSIKGFYDETLIKNTKNKYNIGKAAIVMIDCDIYESTVSVLEFLTDIVQQGTILIFDDWFRFKGSTDYGEQLACKEWLTKNPNIELIEFWRQGPQAISFIVNMKNMN